MLPVLCFSTFLGCFPPCGKQHSSIQAYQLHQPEPEPEPEQAGFGWIKWRSLRKNSEWPSFGRGISTEPISVMGKWGVFDGPGWVTWPLLVVAGERWSLEVVLYGKRGSVIQLFFPHATRVEEDINSQKITNQLELLVCPC